MHNALTKEDKKIVFRVLGDLFLDAMDKNKISKEERKSVSKEILEYIRKATNWNEVLDFIDYYAQKHDYFSSATDTIRTKYHTIKKRRVIENLKKDILNISN